MQIASSVKRMIAGDNPDAPPLRSVHLCPFYKRGVRVNAFSPAVIVCKLLSSWHASGFSLCLPATMSEILSALRTLRHDIRWE